MLVLAAVALVSHVLRRTLPPRFLRPFRSVRFNIWLFVTIAVAASIGTFFPQGTLTPEAADRLGPFLSSILSKSGLLNVYHTPWFAALLGLMAFDVIACKLDKWPRRARADARLQTASLNLGKADVFHGAVQQARFSVNASCEKVSEEVMGWLAGRGFRLLESRPLTGDKQEARLYTADRHRLQRWGDFILHVSIVVVLTGGLIGAMFGFSDMLPIPEKGAADLPQRGWRVELENFDIEYYRNTGEPSLYASEVSVYDDQALVAKQRIIVNEPLDVGGVRFYQATWGMTQEFHSAQLRFRASSLTLEPGRVVPFPGTSVAFRANVFAPSLGVDDHGFPVAGSSAGGNPALQVDVLERGEVAGRLWLLQHHPDLAFRLDTEGRLSRMDPPPFHVASIEPVLFSGIQVSYDPGASVFWVGSVFLLIGLALHFYFHYRRVRLIVTDAGSKTEVKIGAWSSRSAVDFHPEFTGWVNELQRRFDPF